LKVDNHKIILDPYREQTSPNGKAFKVTRVEKDLTKPPKWIGRTEKYYWIVTVTLLETEVKVAFHFDYYDTCIKKIKL
jgi:phage terminase small subunit